MSPRHSIHRVLRRVPSVMLAVSLVGLAYLAWTPVSHGSTRALGLAFAALAWICGVTLLRRRRLAVAGVLAGTAVLSVWLHWPVARQVPAAELQATYAAALAGYEGTPYHWGGENRRGIDCSGLVRRGLINACLTSGVRRLDAATIRFGLDLWWHDCSAKALGTGDRGLTQFVTEAPQGLNQLDPAVLRVGDLAVTTNGVHVMAHLGGGEWIEADPGAGRVITAKTPVARNRWFETPVRILRWRALSTP